MPLSPPPTLPTLTALLPPAESTKKIPLMLISTMRARRKDDFAEQELSTPDISSIRETRFFVSSTTTCGVTQINNS
ncbi:hypothetical protein F5877DRAFT_86948 [Lentinula edodes]|nr:hypothetical protein F5877DRAFT_86948 [Lentinula edodes]